MQENRLANGSDLLANASHTHNSPHGKRRIRVGFAGMKGNKTENASLLDISKLDHTPYNQ